MAVGDIVGAITPSVTWVYFTPAAGVEIIVTAQMGGVIYTRLTNGTLDTGDTNITTVQPMNLKIGITNALYLGWYGTTGTGQAWTGIQIK
jgi:hypothetical protein|tara:strand:+ start:321 stop:590 length:270 start_codon:yes stop_codon:yes gene_type:complete